MKYLQNLHQHSTYCDGKDSPREVVETAIERGFDSIGFSSHSPTRFSENYPMRIERTKNYVDEINALKEEYKDKIAIHLGIELDKESKMDVSPFEYVIASSHYVFAPDGERFMADESLEKTKKAIEKFSSPLNYVQAYCNGLLEIPCPDKPNFVAHFDLVTKFQEQGRLIDEEDKRYREILLDTLRTMSKKFKLFEINTGAMSRGYRTTPYPAPFILKEMKALGIGLVITSDCHNRNFIDCAFDECEKILLTHGINEHFVFKDGIFQPVKL